MRFGFPTRLIWSALFTLVALVSTAAFSGFGSVAWGTTDATAPLDGEPAAAIVTNESSSPEANPLVVEQSTTSNAVANGQAPDEVAIVVCGHHDPEAERAIEALLAGRSFDYSLKSRDDGCADLVVRVAGSALSSGRTVTNVSTSIINTSGSGRTVVTNGSTSIINTSSSGSGGSRVSVSGSGASSLSQSVSLGSGVQIAVEIVSVNGVTRAHIGGAA